MGKSYISLISYKSTPVQNPGLWLKDTDASILSAMIGIELLTDVSLEEWAAIAGRRCLLAAVVCATGAVEPQLYEFAESNVRLIAIKSCLDRVLLKLARYGDCMPGSYLVEHNMLLPGEPIPSALPLAKIVVAVEILKQEADQLLSEYTTRDDITPRT